MEQNFKRWDFYYFTIKNLYSDYFQRTVHGIRMIQYVTVVTVNGPKPKTKGSDQPILYCSASLEVKVVCLYHLALHLCCETASFFYALVFWCSCNSQV